METYHSYFRPPGSSQQESLLARYTQRPPSAGRSRRETRDEGASILTSTGGQLLRLRRSSSNGRAERASVDRSMLPGHNLSSKLEATRQAFKTDASSGRPTSAGPRSRPGSTGRPMSAMRSSAPNPLPPRREGERPRAYTCYLCGQQYGSASLMIHIPQCQKKWIMVEEQKPKRERRPLPPPPPDLAGGQLPTGKNADAFNESMHQHWDQHSLVPCPFCGRTFNPDAFQRHKKVCTADKPGGPLGPGRNQPPGVKPGAGQPASPALRGTGGPSPMRGGGAAGARPGSSGGAGGGGQAPAATGTKGGGGGGMASKPLGFTCYLCGQQYGSASLIIHIGQCQKKWVSTESTKPKREQRPLPPPPPLLHELEALPTSPREIEEFNQAMYSYWDKISLVGCGNCGRTFRPDAFERHAKVCTQANPASPGPGGLPGKGGSSSPVKTGGGGGGSSRGVPNHDSRPRAYNCYLCGQQYGVQSLLIHIPQCYTKWLKVEATKPPKERREPPPPPPELDEPLPTDLDEIDAFNARMCGAFNDKSLAKCSHCGRSMRPDALPRHQKLCTADSPMKGGGGGAGSASSASSSPAAAAISRSGGQPAEFAEGNGEDLEECPHCNRSMRPEALSKHQRVCTADKPMKAVTRQPQPQPPLVPRPPSGGASSHHRRPPSAQQHRPSSGSQSSTRPTPPPPPQEVYPDEEEDAGMEYGQDESSGMAYSSGYGQGVGFGADSYGGDAADDLEDRIPCGTCGRKFAPEALAKHSRVCAKVFASKRKPFNVAKQRMQGTEMASIQRSARPPASASGPRTQRAQPASRPAASAAAAAPGGAGGMPKWKAQSESLRQAMAAQRQVASALARGENLRNLPPPPSIPDPSFIQCPHCGRRFNQQAAERHIPSCANTYAKPKFLKAGTGGSGQGAPQSRRLPR